jgi:hypothetical protein
MNKDYDNLDLFLDNEEEKLRKLHSSNRRVCNFFNQEDDDIYP